MPLLIKGLYKSFGEITLFENFNIEIEENTITCILGPSGCGKTTLLNLISNNSKADKGQFEGYSQKELSYIFQEPRLLPWKTVKQNIAFVLNKHKSKSEKLEIADKYMRLVELEKFADFYPSKLSGGMKQRVAIARAFSYGSDIILMDEPLKALDIKLKLNLIKAFGQLWLTDKRTVIFVTHDIDEALLLGNNIYVFSEAPVKINKKFTLDIPFAERALNSDKMNKIKIDILRIM